MKNKSFFNSGRGGRVAGTGPNNSSVIAGSSKKAAYSEAEIVDLSRKKTGEDYNKFQDRIKKDFEKYLRESTAEWNDANLDVRFNLIQSFILNQQQHLELMSAIADLRQSTSKTELEQKINPKQLRQSFNNKNIPKALAALILVLVTTELVIRSSDESTATVSKVTNAVALGIAGGAIAGPVGSVAGIIVGGLVSEVEANNNKVKQEDFNQFLNGCAAGSLPIVRSKISQAKAQGNLKSLLTKLDSQYKLPPLVITVLKGNDKVVKEILASVKDNPELLKIVLIQTDQSERSPLYLAAFLEKTEVVKEILASVKDHPKLLEKILTQVDEKKGMSPLYAACSLGKTSVVKEILASVKDKPLLLKKILIQVDKQGVSPLYAASSLGKTSVVKEILASVKDKLELFNTLIKYKPTEYIKSNLAIVHHLLIAGDNEAIKTILEVNPHEVIKKLPNIYFSNIPKTAIYYLEAFLKTDKNLEGTKIKYFELDKNSEPKEVKIDGIKLSSDNKNPTIIEIKNGVESIKALLATDINFDKELSLRKAIDVASDKKLGINKIIFNLAVKYPEGEHGTTIKLKRNTANKGWDVVIHDPNAIYSSSSQGEGWKKINNEAITKLCQNVGIKITSLKEAKAIIPNYGNQDIDGSCDMIASIAAASLILGDEHSRQLTAKCDKIGVKCVEVLGQELNPEIDKILAARLQSIKNSLKPEIREEAGPSSFVEEAKAEKLKSKSVHAGL